MQTRSTLRRPEILVVLALLAWAGGRTLRAHEVTYQGTIVAVEAARLQVKTVSPATKKEEGVWFTVTKSTKVKRGAKLVTYAAAGMAKDERVVVIVDHDAAATMVAIEIRLAARQ